MIAEPSKAELRACARRARKLHPNATRIVARWYAGEPYAEVWDGDRARTVFA